MSCIEYNSGYKYQLQRDFTLRIPIRPPAAIATDFLGLDLEGLLTICKGYAWDGPSGPTLDTRSFMRGSLVHDALYQLMRESHLDRATHRAAADRLLRELCLEDGMWPPRAWWVWKGVAWFGDPSSDPAHRRPHLWAPKDCRS